MVGFDRADWTKHNSYLLSDAAFLILPICQDEARSVAGDALDLDMAFLRSLPAKQVEAAFVGLY